MGEIAITLRPVQPVDEEFLFTVYSSTRADEMVLITWNAAEKEAFLRMQFNAQRHFYQENYPDALFQIVMLEDQPIGRLYVSKREDEIRIMDIAILPEYRDQGIGSALLNETLKEARKYNLPVTIHVERFNPALHLYERLGFRQIEDKGVYFLMEWSPTIMEHTEHAG